MRSSQRPYYREVYWERLMTAFYRAYKPCRTAFVEAVTALQATNAFKVTLGEYDFPSEALKKRHYGPTTASFLAVPRTRSCFGDYGRACLRAVRSAVIRAFLSHLAAEPRHVFSSGSRCEWIASFWSVFPSEHISVPEAEYRLIPDPQPHFEGNSAQKAKKTGLLQSSR